MTKGTKKIDNKDMHFFELKQCSASHFNSSKYQNEFINETIDQGHKKIYTNLRYLRA